jgi:hypothetical protein
MVGETLPHCAAVQDTVQLTPPFAGSSVTFAVKGAMAPARTMAGVGVTESVIAMTAMVTERDWVGSVTEVAVTLTEKFAATGLGAV